MTYVLLNKIQEQARKAVVTALAKDNKALLQMATGTGKTETAKKILDSILSKEPQARILWLVHSNELLEQTANRILNSSPELNLGIFSGEVKCTFSQITIASIQTLSRINNLKKFNPKEIQYIFVDEAHHSPSNTWDRILKYFSKAKKFGFTATPYRPDGRTLEESFGTPVFELPFTVAQDKKLLAKDESYLILTNSVLTPSVTREGEYSQKSLDRLFVSRDRNEIVVKSYLKYGRAKMTALGIAPKAVCYCINSEHAKRMSELFNRHGIKAAFLVGDVKQLSAAARSETYQQFRDTHNIEILCTVNIFNEAIDIPDLACAIMARPTRSNIVYSQQLGRAARILHGKKEKFIILDYVDNTRAEFQGYTSSNLFKRGAAHTTTVVEYMTEADPVLIEQRVTNVTKGIEEFENKFKNPAGYWTLEKCKNEALKYKGRWEWQKKHGASYSAARYLGFLEICCKHMKKCNVPVSYWNTETCTKMARRYKTRLEWQKKHLPSYTAACALKILDICSPHMRTIKPKKYWTLKKCKQIALQYSSVKEWKDGNLASVSAARHLGCYYICVEHMTGRRQNFWTKNECKKEALKYKTRGKWARSNQTSYNKACKYNWLEECCAHMS